MRDAVESMERAMISAAMARHRGNKKKVAEELGVSRAYLYKKLQLD
ncbi:MAG: helix-turn-helix domain-containing protein [Burkholderiaceae bacterium]